MSRQEVGSHIIGAVAAGKVQLVFHVETDASQVSRFTICQMNIM
jgi:hypothetical protein